MTYYRSRTELLVNLGVAKSDKEELNEEDEDDIILYKVRIHNFNTLNLLSKLITLSSRHQIGLSISLKV